MNKPTQTNPQNNFRSNLVYNLAEEELKKIEVEKDVFVRLIGIGSDKYIDIRKFYKGYPTKKGLRFRYETFDIIRKIFNNEF